MVSDPKPGDAVVGVAVRRGLEVLAWPSTVYVLPASDVLSGKRVVVLPGGGLAMRKRGRPRKGSVLVMDSLWGSDAKAGDLALLCLGITMAKKAHRVQRRALRRAL